MKEPKYVREVKVIRAVKVIGEKNPRPVFYTRREMLFDARGRICKTPLELSMDLATAISSRDTDSVGSICWDALNFVYNGNVPKNWNKLWKKHGATPLAI
jgi:hypothetical protein